MSRSKTHQEVSFRYQEFGWQIGAARRVRMRWRLKQGVARLSLTLRFCVRELLGFSFVNFNKFKNK